MSAELHLIASIAGRTVAFASSAVESVIDLDQVVPVPRASAGVAGIAALRSRVVTVVDPCVPLGVEPVGERPRRAVVTNIDGHVYAILVDAVHDVAPHVALPTPPGMPLDGGWGAAARGVIDRDGAPVLTLDTAALIPQAG